VIRTSRSLIALGFGVLSDRAATVPGVDRGGRPLHSDLRALAYHRDVADWLEQKEPRGWQTMRAGLQPAAGQSDQETEAAAATDLLRSAYRLQAGGHPLVHSALARAVENLGIDRPVAIYQVEGSGAANAGLLTLPDELAILLSGNLIPLLSEDGLCAVFGHELAHHLLWTYDDERYQVADRLLQLLSVDAATPPPYLEAFRRYRLATELFADRGAVVACGSLLNAVGALVTTVTGLADVDPAGYLAQAEAADPLSGSRASGHPETVLRAWALSRWHCELDADLGSEPQAEGPGELLADRLPAGEVAAKALLRPRLDLDALDLFDQAELERLTLSLIEDLLLDREWQSEAVLGHARQFFPELTTDPAAVSPLLPSAETAAVPAEPWGTPVFGVRPLTPGSTSPQTRRYLGYVLLDLVTVDPDLDLELALGRASRFAERLGLGPDFDRVARAELQLSTAAWTRVGTAIHEAAG
jgi:Peptidase family M48